MDNESSSMLVTFIGGPLHGKHGRMANPPHQWEAINPDGSRMLYEKRNWIGDGRPLRWTSVSYAPLGMPDQEFNDLWPTVEPPLDL